MKLYFIFIEVYLLKIMNRFLLFQTNTKILSGWIIWQLLDNGHQINAMKIPGIVDARSIAGSLMYRNFNQRY